MRENAFLTVKDLENIPPEMLPMPVLSDNLRSFFSWGIKAHTEGSYNHFMWMIYPGVLASQNTLFQKEPVASYVKKCRLKLWYCKTWTVNDRIKVINAIEQELARPWYKRCYDYFAILAQLLWCEMQIPGFDICSDKGKFINMVDPSYDLSHPDPAQINVWLGEHPDKYEVYGRYVPD